MVITMKGDSVQYLVLNSSQIICLISKQFNAQNMLKLLPPPNRTQQN